MSEANKYCEQFDSFFSTPEVRAYVESRYPEVARVLPSLRSLVIGKSCLLSRMIYGGERPSKTRCPVHSGKWAGIHIGWPGGKWSDGRDIPESEQCREWYDAGCRCFQHSCGCTTGWQPEAAP